MGGLVIAVGALMLAAGGYEMYAGSGDILSERGWSAFIAGSVLVAGGIVTMAIGVAVRALDRLRGAMLGNQLAPASIAAPVAQVEPAARAAAPPPVAPPAPQPDLPPEPMFEQAPTAPLLAAAPIEHAAAPEQPRPTAEAPPAFHVEAETHYEPADPEPQHDDWLDHSFAELEREAGGRHEATDATPSPHPETAPEPTPSPPDTLPAADEPHPSSFAHEEPRSEVIANEPVAHETHLDAHDTSPPEPVADHATVSAREEPVPATSAVIGRYESEGTSYVMYADGSIDAQSEAGIYRFASMAELKTFIES